MAKNSRVETLQPLEENKRLEPRSHPVQQRSRKTVNRILETAAELVDEVGVVGFTTNLVAERADIRIRTIYRYFPSKLGILSALMLHLNDDSAERLKQLSELGDPECDWRELVCRVVRRRREVDARTSGVPGSSSSGSHNIPGARGAARIEMDEEWAHSLMDAMRARGVDLPPKQLYAVCRTFTETIDSMASLAGWEGQGCSDEIVEEARLHARPLPRALPRLIPSVGRVGPKGPPRQLADIAISRQEGLNSSEIQRDPGSAHKLLDPLRHFIHNDSPFLVIGS